MKRPDRQADGLYHIGDVAYKLLLGSREQVMNGTAYKTPGQLRKADLVRNKHGRIVSAKKFKSATQEQRLLQYGYGAKKGKFGFVRVGGTRRKRLYTR
jgi:hypothetical protein